MGSPERAGGIRPDADRSTWNSVQLVCDFVNTEVSRTRGRIIAIAIACTLGAILVPVVVPLFDARILLLLGGGVFVFLARRLRADLRSTWNGVAIKRLVAALGRRLTYQPRSTLSRDQLAATELFPGPGLRFECVHQVSGGAAGAGFSLHQVRVAATPRAKDVFLGVVVRLDAPRAFTGHTIVVPDRDSALTGPGASRARDVVMLKNPAFERAFSTYSTDYAEARKVLTPAVLQYLLGASDMVGADMRLALMGRAVYVTIPCGDLFPPVALFAAPVSPELLAPLVRVVAFAEGLTAVLRAASPLQVAR